MIEQQGRIIQRRGNQTGILVSTLSGCAACDNGKGCNAAIFSKLFPRRPIWIRSDEAIDVRPGQLVSFGLPERVYLRALSRVYLLPLLSALAGTAIGHHLALRLELVAGMNDGISFAGGVLFFALALFMSRTGETEIQECLEIRLIDETGGRFSEFCNPGKGQPAE